MRLHEQPLSSSCMQIIQPLAAPCVCTESWAATRLPSQLPVASADRVHVCRPCSLRWSRAQRLPRAPSGPSRMHSTSRRFPEWTPTTPCAWLSAAWTAWARPGTGSSATCPTSFPRYALPGTLRRAILDVDCLLPCVQALPLHVSVSLFLLLNVHGLQSCPIWCGTRHVPGVAVFRSPGHYVHLWTLHEHEIDLRASCQLPEAPQCAACVLYLSPYPSCARLACLD